MTDISSWAPPRDDEVELAEVGGKAAGLFRLLKGWTPPFFIVQSGTDYGESLEQLLRIIGPATDAVIVRSNACSESASVARGRYTSIVTPAEAGAIRNAIDRVLMQPSQAGDKMLAMVQMYVRPVASGHLSNERHVAQRRTQWILDEEDQSSTRVAQSVTARNDHTDELLAADRAQMLITLRHVAFRLAADEERVHCEWVWDGSRTWIVQRDTEAENRGGPVYDYLSARPERSTAADRPITTLIRALDAEQTSAWSKLGRPSTLTALGMPTAPVWHLDGAAFAADRRHGFQSVITDLEALMAPGPLVVRCDVAASSGYDALSLPTSDPYTKPADALDFMERVASQTFDEMPCSDWAFLPAPLVNARASVMAQARPGSQRVRLHALWGFPDGVGLLGHDKWSYDTITGAIEERRSYKASCWLPMGDDGWSFEPVPAPFDWGHTIDRHEAAEAARWARELADHLDREVQLMVLARIDGRRGPEAMIAWHYTDHIVPPAPQHVAILPSSGICVLTSHADLEAADLPRHRGVLVRPEPGIHRDPAFLTAVGKLAAEADVPIYFEGSVLGHPYFLLKSAGATIVPVGRGEPGGVRIEYNKLVRDGVPDVIESSGGAARIVRASGQQAGALLRHKLIEEAFEVSGADPGQIVEELADLADVLTAMMRDAHVDPAVVERMREEKRAARGAFDALLYMEATSSDPGDEADALEAPTLFGDEYSGGQVPAPYSPPAVTIEESNNRRLVLRIPAMPPIRNGIPLRQYRVDVGEGIITFQHEGAEIEIAIDRAQPDGIEQLRFPIEPN